MNLFGYLYNLIVDGMGLKTPWDVVRAVIDIGIVAYVIYKAILLVRETRAWQLVKGIVVILIALKVSDYAGLKTVAFILNNTIQYITIALIVLFQPELRRALEKIGRSRFGHFFDLEQDQYLVKVSSTVEEITKAAENMSKDKTGSIIVIEGKTKIGEIINSGVDINANVTAELLINIFTPNTPLHDGAIIIRDNKIKAAACFLPLTDNLNLNKNLGTRHRAALGITEISDCIVVIVSEETGGISIASNGSLTQNITIDTLRKILNKVLVKEDKRYPKRLMLWKVKPR